MDVSVASAHSDWAHEPKAERKAERSAVAAYLISLRMDVLYGGAKSGRFLARAHPLKN
jgi:hypothetical protein